MNNSFLESNPLFRDIYCWLAGNEGNAAVCKIDGILPGYDLGTNWASFIGFFLTGFILMFIVVNGVMLGTALYTWAFRRLMARFQNRIGPNRWGPFGLLQPIVDLIKMLGKENITPRVADKVLFSIAPIILLGSVLLIMVVVPFGKNTFIADLNIGVLFIVAIGGFETIGIFLAGWSSGNRFALFGAVRAVAMLLSYEIPLVISLVGVVLIAGSMSLVDIAESQKNIIFVLVQPIGFFVVVLSASAEMNRTPFDIVEAESELVAGFHTEYTGMKYGVIQAAEFAALLVYCAILANMYFGGWSGFFLSDQLGALWFLLKIVIFIFIFEWVRLSIPRLRIDQIMSFAWKFLFPLSLINLLITAVQVYIFNNVTTPGVITSQELWIMAAINIVLAISLIPLFGFLVKDRIVKPYAKTTTQDLILEKVG